MSWPELNFRAGLIGPDGRPWFGTSDGLLRWTGESWIRELRGVTVFPKMVARDGAVWAGSAASGLLRYAADTWTEIPLPSHLEGSEVFDVVEGLDGTIWIATSSGVGRIALED